MKKVKEYRNVLQEPFFEIPIEQVLSHNLPWYKYSIILGVNARPTY